jgi:hypothetical protein
VERQKIHGIGSKQTQNSEAHWQLTVTIQWDKRIDMADASRIRVKSITPELAALGDDGGDVDVGPGETLVSSGGGRDNRD